MPKTKSNADDVALYQAALEGLELQKQRLEEQIRRVRALLKGRKPASGVLAISLPEAKPVRKRELSAAARQRIAAAQRKRWTEYRKKKKAAAKPA